MLSHSVHLAGIPTVLVSRPSIEVQKGEDEEVMGHAKLRMWDIGHDKLRRDTLYIEPEL